MRKVMAVVGSAIFLVIAPGTLAGLVPWWITRWVVQPPLFGFEPARWLGWALVALGLPVLVESFARFALQGAGTPAPVFPTTRLIVTGFYRYVRNPMYVAVVATILGQALIFGHVRLLIYGAAVWAAFALFVLVYEEPTLMRTYGAEYETYRRHVRAWIPRLTPWRG